MHEDCATPEDVDCIISDLRGVISVIAGTIQMMRKKKAELLTNQTKEKGGLDNNAR